MSSETVAQHYNAVRQDGIAARSESRIYYLRNLNNWMKSELINEAMQMLRDETVIKMFRPRVLDLACGKGGDLRKWMIASVDSVVMADVADVSLSQAKERYNEMAQRERSSLFSAEFIHADCCKVNLKSLMKSRPEFDLVSCQFALHYSFIDEPSARNFLRNATETLRPGGYLIGTLPDAERIVWAVRQNDGEFKNAVCSIRYDNKEELGKPPLFGAKFHFTLDSQVNCPEFLAYFPLVEKLLEELDMELVFVRRFPEALQHWKTTGAGLLSRMQALEPYPPRNGAKLSAEESEYEQAKQFMKTLDSRENPSIFPSRCYCSHPMGAAGALAKANKAAQLQRISMLSLHVFTCIMGHLYKGTLSKSEWEAFSMYLVFAFRKKGSQESAGKVAEPKLDEKVECKKRRIEEDGESTTT